jgi:hypothetical protein
MPRRPRLRASISLRPARIVNDCKTRGAALRD